jgi:hypothetical protein
MVIAFVAVITMFFALEIAWSPGARDAVMTRGITPPSTRVVRRVPRRFSSTTT